MDAKKAAAAILASKPSKKSNSSLEERPLKGKSGKFVNRNIKPDYKEDALIDAIDQKRMIEKHAAWITKLREGRIGVEQFFNGVGPEAAIELFFVAMSGRSEKTRLDALRDLLDRAGYTKVQKVAVGNIDPNAPKEQLKAIVAGLMKKQAVRDEIEIVGDDGEDKT